LCPCRSEPNGDDDVEASVDKRLNVLLVIRDVLRHDHIEFGAKTCGPLTAFIGSRLKDLSSSYQHQYNTNFGLPSCRSGWRFSAASTGRDIEATINATIARYSFFMYFFSSLEIETDI
jgi:hypothetical protein